MKHSINSIFHPGPCLTCSGERCTFDLILMLSHHLSYIFKTSLFWASIPITVLANHNDVDFFFLRFLRIMLWCTKLGMFHVYCLPEMLGILEQVGIIFNHVKWLHVKDWCCHFLQSVSAEHNEKLCDSLHTLWLKCCKSGKPKIKTSK